MASTRRHSETSGPRGGFRPVAFIGLLLVALVALGLLPTPARADTAPAVTINDVTQTRPSSETSTYAFTITLEHPVQVPVTVSWNTSDGTAVAGVDYQAASGSSNFAPG